MSVPANLYRVKVREHPHGMPQAGYELVIASDPHTALDMVSEALDEPDTLYDEEIQRAIVDHEIAEHRVERKYDDYIEQVDFVGRIK